MFALVAAGFGYAMHGAEHRLDLAQSRSHAIAPCWALPDARMMTGRVSTGGSATVVMSHRASALVFTAADLRSLPHARAYQLWLMGPSGSRSIGVLPAARGGMAGPMIISGLAPGDAVGLTVRARRRLPAADLAADPDAAALTAAAPGPAGAAAGASRRTA